MTHQEIELRLEKVEKIKLDTQRKVDAKRDVEMGQKLIESCDNEIKELREKLKRR